ncbi:MAG: cation:proton antiporter [Acidobacteriota bacterium]|nr:MAG: cation:proton antiporter [Acidobacteriota bacterium]
MNIVFELSLLLAAGFAAARLARLAYLPAVSGYILAGIALGPTGFDIFGKDLAASEMGVFTNIALMLVAFGIGERFDLQQLRPSAKALIRVSLGEIGLTFLLVCLGVSFAAWATIDNEGFAGGFSWLASLGLVAGSIAVATAPATVVVVIRELEASGPVSRLALSSVVVNNAISVTLFGLTVAASRSLLGVESGSGPLLIVIPILKTVAALLLGVLIGFLTDVLVHRLTRRDEVLIVALAAVFFCGGLASLLGLSSILAGVAAGFAVVNRDRRDVRAFRALNDFEPPLYGIFFALAGAELDLAELAAGGIVGVVFVLTRAAGKYFGAWWGARSAGLPEVHQKSLGLGLMPQAGLAIALAFLIRQDPSMEAIRSVLLSAIITSVVVNELIGPPLVRLMALRAREIQRPIREPDEAVEDEENAIVRVAGWTEPKLVPARFPDGYVLFGLSHPGTTTAVTRLATLMSHHFKAAPLAVRIITGEQPDSFWNEEPDRQSRALFSKARLEAGRLGYPLRTDSEYALDTAEGILRVAESVPAQAIVLGHPFSRRVAPFERIVDAVARESICPVVVAKLQGTLEIQRILVPLTDLDEMNVVAPFVSAFGGLPGREVHFLRLLPHETPEAERETQSLELESRMQLLHLAGTGSAIGTESRMHSILKEAEQHDLVIMSASGQRGLRRVFFGSLAEDVALRIEQPMLLIRGGIESRPLEGFR